MIALRKQQHVEAIYFNTLYIRINLVTYQDKQAFISVMISTNEALYDGNPFVLDFDMPPQIRETLALTTLNSLREDNEYLNETYYNINRKIDNLRETFIRENAEENFSEQERQTAWNQYKLINLEVEEMEFMEPFQRAKKYINSYLNEDVSPEQIKMVVENALNMFFK